MNEAEELDSIREELIEDSRQEAEFKISKKAVDRRRSKPTGEGSCVESTGRKRRRETMAVVSGIHGGSKDNLKPGTIGMMETLNKCSWLVSFLNIGHGVLSSNENFLLFGANCAENCLPVKRFLGKLITDIK